MNMTAKQISIMLAHQAENVAQNLLPNGKRVGQEWCVGSVDGEEGKSLKVHLSGDKSGLWCDFSTGDKGDLLDLWCKTRKINLSEVIKEAIRYLGIGQPSFEPAKALNFVKPVQKNLSSLTLTSPVMNYLVNERKLNSETIHAFKIGEQDRKIVFPYWRDGELVFIKYLSLDRIDGKKHISVEKNCEPCLFGWHLVPINARTITICEGEIDAMTLYQYGHPTLSVPFGGGTGNKHKWLEYEFDRLAIFDEIYFCFDNDPEGKAAISELTDRLGRHRCRIVELPHKDANACLQADITKEEISKLFQNAKTLDPKELKPASLFVNQVINEFYPSNETVVGYLPPWDKTEDKIIFRPDELSIWTGVNGHGKSQFIGQILLHAMKQGARVCIASLELKPQRLLMRLTRQTAGLTHPTVEYINAIHSWYDDKLWLFDLVGNAKSERLLEVFKYARQRYGIDVFVIDSFMKLDIAEDDYRTQKLFLEQLCDFKNEHNVHVHLIIHPRKGMDESKLPGKLDVKGTGALTDLADNCFVIWRNKNKQESINKLTGQGQKPDGELLNQPDCLWICDKQRNGEWEGKFGLWFHGESFQYLNHPQQRPIQYVPYSNLAGK